MNNWSAAWLDMYKEMNKFSFFLYYQLFADSLIHVPTHDKAEVREDYKQRLQGLLSVGNKLPYLNIVSIESQAREFTVVFSCKFVVHKTQLKLSCENREYFIQFLNFFFTGNHGFNFNFTSRIFPGKLTW